MNITVVFAAREKLTRWQAARYRAQSLMEGRFRQLAAGLASMAAVAAFALAVAVLLIILGLVP